VPSLVGALAPERHLARAVAASFEFSVAEPQKEPEDLEV